MNEEIKDEESQEEPSDKQEKIRSSHLFKKGQSGNPKGRPPGKSLKEYTRQYLACMTEEERESFLDGLPKEVVWKMAEGQPHQTSDVDVEIKPTPMLNALLNNHSNTKDTSTEETG